MDSKVNVPRRRTMRNMKAGDVTLFRGLQTHRQQVSTIQVGIGGKFTQFAALLLDPKGQWLEPVTVVECVEEPNKSEGKGRPSKRDERHTEALVAALEFLKTEIELGDHRQSTIERMRTIRNHVFESLGKPSIAKIEEMKAAISKAKGE